MLNFLNLLLPVPILLISSHAINKIHSVCCPSNLRKTTRIFYALFFRSIYICRNVFTSNSAAQSIQFESARYLRKPKNSRSLLEILTSPVDYFSKTCVKQQNWVPAEDLQAGQTKIVPRKLENFDTKQKIKVSTVSATYPKKKKYESKAVSSFSTTILDLSGPKKIKRQYSTITQASLRQSKENIPKRLVPKKANAIKRYSYIQSDENGPLENSETLTTKECNKQALECRPIEKKRKQFSKNIHALAVSKSENIIKKSEIPTSREYDHKPVEYNMIEFNKKPYRYKFDKEEDEAPTREDVHQDIRRRIRSLARTRSLLDSASKLAYELALIKRTDELDPKGYNVPCLSWKKQKILAKIKQKNIDAFWTAVYEKSNSFRDKEIIRGKNSKSNMSHGPIKPKEGEKLPKSQPVIRDVLILYEKVKKGHADVKYQLSLNCAQPTIDDILVHTADFDTTRKKKHTKRTTILELMLNNKKEKFREDSFSAPASSILKSVSPIPVLSGKIPETIPTKEQVQIKTDYKDTFSNSITKQNYNINSFKSKTMPCIDLEPDNVEEDITENYTTIIEAVPFESRSESIINDFNKYQKLDKQNKQTPHLAVSTSSLKGSYQHRQGLTRTRHFSNSASRSAYDSIQWKLNEEVERKFKALHRKEEKKPGPKVKLNYQNAFWVRVAKKWNMIPKELYPNIQFQFRPDVTNNYTRPIFPHLWRLPKTTPEGYRVVMYSVRDNDPTKMVFSDCVKTFCMFNDIVLSEDGIEEGYIVVFDMKGVQLGHLARVSLPALRCFFMYIQEAHPVKIKGVHVLNTATWVHHIMRIVMPLVKSELLSLVKFHKGNNPEGMPLEIMPMDYGGETSTAEDLDRVTESLWQKYHQWLLDNEQLKSDETKRNTKKSSWWGWPFFGTKSNEDLDEKNIIKNLRYE